MDCVSHCLLLPTLHYGEAQVTVPLIASPATATQGTNHAPLLGHHALFTGTVKHAQTVDCFPLFITAYLTLRGNPSNSPRLRLSCHSHSQNHAPLLGHHALFTGSSQSGQVGPNYRLCLPLFIHAYLTLQGNKSNSPFEPHLPQPSCTGCPGSSQSHQTVFFHCLPYITGKPK